MGWICACCFASNDGKAENAKCSRCEGQSCDECSKDKVLLEVVVEEDAKAPDVEKEDYADFLARFEDAILPAYREHFENPVRKRWRTRLEVCRAMIFSQAMLNYRADVCQESDLSAAEVRYAVAFRSFGKLKKDPKEPVIFLDATQKKGDDPVTLRQAAWTRRSAACALAYLRMIKVPEEAAKKISGLLLDQPDTTADDIIRDAFALESLRKVAEEKEHDAKAYLAEADKVMKGKFKFLFGEDNHADAREAMLAEAGLLIRMTAWDDDAEWRKIGRGALARVERVINDYSDVFPFLSDFYFEGAPQKYVVS